MTIQMLCCFSAPGRGPCPAYSDVRSPHGYCFAHEEIYLHDCALAFRRKARDDEHAAVRWAEALRLPIERLRELADVLNKHERPIALDLQGL